MTTVLTPIEKLTVQEFVRLLEEEGAFEIIHGEKIKLMPTLLGHSLIANKLLRLLLLYLSSHAEGEVFHETTFILPDTYDRDWVKGSRIPDVMVVGADALKTYQNQNADYAERPLAVVPELAVEVVSSHDSYSDIEEKVELYLQDGVKLVWVIDPRRRKVTVYHAEGQNRLGEADILSGKPVLSDFSIQVSSLFD